jgi:lipopolysaccharide transport system ATP-binding protein
MAEPPIQIENVSKRYYLGTGFHGNLSQVLEAKLRDPVRRLLGRSEGHATENKEFWALRNVSLEMEPGTVTGLIGANGAGKSTLLKMLARITPPTEGRITMRGRVGSLLEVGTGFHPELTGRENVFLNGAILGMGRQEIFRRYEEIVEFSGIEKFIETPVKRYSSGMYVRLAFAVAAHLDTDILLLDEVLAVGDAEFQRRSLGKIDSSAASGRTIVFVSHDLANVQRLCDRCVWIDGGRVVAMGNTSDVVGEYLKKSTAGEPHAELSGGVSQIPGDIERNGTGEALLRSLEMTDLDGEPVANLHLGQPFRVTATFDVFNDLPEAVFEVGVSTLEGEQILAAQTSDGGGRPLAVAKGRRQITVELDPGLLPQEFAISVGMHRSNGVTVDMVRLANQFRVINASESGEDRYPWATVRGYARPRAIWGELESAPAAEAPSSPSASSPAR